MEREQVAQVTGTNKDDSGPKKPKQRAAEKVYPNDPCPCGSGKKYKQCCGKKSNLTYKKKNQKEGEAVVELDQFKTVLNSYTEPLVEVRDSL